MHFFFSHGRSGRPDGDKIKRLSALVVQRGHTTQSIDYTDTVDPEERAQRLGHLVKQQKQPFVLVGSSMGGYASLVAAELADKRWLKGVFLMAPALFLPRYRQQQFAADLPCVEVVHGWHDTTVLYEHSIRYARQTYCLLHLLDDNHRLSKNPQQLERLFTGFLSRLEQCKDNCYI